VRSLAFAARQEQSVRPRVARAVTALNALDERQQGKLRLPDEAAADQAATAILATPRVEGLVHVTVTPEVREHVKRRDGMRPATTVRSARVRVYAAPEEAPLAQAVRRLGWRGYATKHTAEALRLAQGVAASRRAYLIAQGFGRLKGRSLSLTPWFLRHEQRVVALIALLSIALRVLVWRQCVVRRHLQHTGATRKGIYPGQPGRQTAQPTTEMMLGALRGVTLSRIKQKLRSFSHPLQRWQWSLSAFEDETLLQFPP
jgi:transposase